MSRISAISAWEVFDSRGSPTVAVDVVLDSGVSGYSMVPSGASTGSREACELRDGDMDRMGGRGVLRAVEGVEREISGVLLGLDADDQERIDGAMIELDGTENKGRIGANAILGVSLAVARAAACSRNLELHQHLADLYGPAEVRMPVPMMNILNGGAHADNNVDIQEFMIQPVSMPTFRDALSAGVEIFNALKMLLAERGFATSVGDEGGFAPDLESNIAGLELIEEAVAKSGYRVGKDVLLAVDCAASEFFRDGSYHLVGDGHSFTSENFCKYLEDLANQFPIASIEDGMDENDWHGWRMLTDCLGDRIQLVGDDLFVTNTEILARGISERIANAILIKLNQIGTLSETLSAIRMAHENGYSVVVSHRSGETEDTFIADLAVATGAGQIKAGSLSRSERVAKYNRLLRIESTLNDSRYLGVAEFRGMETV
ncbi:MAG: phosphopyruvate hydratase [Pseudomonadota bacterium]|nr:phosphopyruvate hydratase [Pseudomonadota bacterium]